jgi:hypothetical protein
MADDPFDMSGYPTVAQVDAAGVFDLLRWTRTLPSPDDEHRPVLERILKRLGEEREKDNDAYVAASKRLMR